MASDDTSYGQWAAANTPGSAVFQVNPSGSAWAECDIKGCRNVATRLVVNPETDELLQVICVAHEEINALGAEVESLGVRLQAAEAALVEISRCSECGYHAEVARAAAAASGTATGGQGDA